MPKIIPLDSDQTDLNIYTTHLADCVIKTHDNKLLCQLRPSNWNRDSKERVCIFGGHVEENETITGAVMREIKEETGGIIALNDLLFIGAVTEEETTHTEAVHIHFWHDKDNTITGCYEAKAITFKNVNDALNDPRMMDYAKWALTECNNKGLLG